MRQTVKAVLIAMLAATGPVMAPGSGSSLRSGPAAIQLRAVVQERLSLVPATQLVGFNMLPTQWTRADRPLTFTTSWNLEAARTMVVVSAFFEDAKGALTSLGSTNENRIATDDVWGKTANGAFTSFAPFSGMVRWPGRGRELFRQPLIPGAGHLASRTDQLDLEVDNRGRTFIDPAGYQGVMTLVVEAY